MQRDGTPSGGFNCGNFRDPETRRIINRNAPGSRPDFIFIEGSYREENPNSYIIGDIKLVQRAAAEDIIPPPDNQWLAMANYAREYQRFPFVGYISLLEAFPGQRGVSKSDRKKMGGEALERGVVLVLVNLVD